MECGDAKNDGGREQCERKAVKAIAKLDGATVSLDDYGYYSRKTARFILEADKKWKKSARKEH